MVVFKQHRALYGHVSWPAFPTNQHNILFFCGGVLGLAPLLKPKNFGLPTHRGWGVIHALNIWKIPPEVMKSRVPREVREATCSIPEPHGRNLILEV